MAMNKLYTEEEVRLIIEGAIAEEREACAKLLERTDLSGLKNAPDIQVFLAAILNAHIKAIRARGNNGL
jgi:hypothetical protein